MIEILKNWAREVLTPTADAGRVDLTIRRSGAVQFDVPAYLASTAGQKQLSEVHDLTQQLQLKSHISA